MGAFFRKLPEPVTVDALVARIPVTATVVGRGDRPIHGIAPLGPGHDDALSFCDPGGTAERVRASPSAVVIVAPTAGMQPGAAQTLIVVDDPRAWFIQAVDALLPAVGRPAEPNVGVHRDADVHSEAQIADSAAIGDAVRIGAGTRIGPGAVIYTGSVIGANCVIGPGTAIGWVGLAYHEDRLGIRRFFPHLAGVRVGDWVDIGANACVCQGILSDTTIGNQVKMGSLVYVGHGAVIEDRVWISAATAIAGHSHVGEGGLIGIGSIIIDNVATAPGVLVGAGSVVTRNAQTGEKLAGVPARPIPTLRRFGPTPR
jgi:UDP-3-O-[3-hydroxymyristoyl] glucosamine N-acyltransferase